LVTNNRLMDIFFHHSEILIFISISVNYFNENLKLLRTAWGLSQTVMAKKYGVSQSSYGRWEVDTEPRLDVLLELAEYFKVSFGDFITKKLEPKDIPPRWGGKEYPPQPEETAKAVEEPGMIMSDKVTALMGKVLGRMDRLEQEHQRLRQALADKEAK
jgi:transcriptional regulator with XRE-family HTH domain